jgi:Zn-dependent protease
MFLSVREIIDIFIAVVATGYIFMDMLRRPGSERDTFGNRLLFSIAIAAPAVVLHEFGHKFVAMALGYTAVFHAAYVWLGIGIVMKLLSFPFLFVVPAYVSIYGPTGLPHAYVAFAGPAVNLLLWLGAWVALKVGKWGRTTEAVLYYTRTINMFLFIFNMLPLPGFDGWSFYTNLF